MSKLVHVAGQVAVPGLEHDLVCLPRGQLVVLVLELVAVRPVDAAAHGGHQVEPAFDRSPIDVVVEGDLDRCERGHFLGAAQRRVIDDLRGRATAGDGAGQQGDHGDREGPGLHEPRAISSGS